jgi:ligand-binding SRPBCC domain-containing protein
MSPKDAVLDFHENDDAMPPLFPPGLLESVVAHVTSERGRRAERRATPSVGRRLRTSRHVMNMDQTSNTGDIKTMSPKDAVLDFHENDDAMPPLFLLPMSPANGEEGRKGERPRLLAGDCERADMCP